MPLWPLVVGAVVLGGAVVAAVASSGDAKLSGARKLSAARQRWPFAHAERLGGAYLFSPVSRTRQAPGVTHDEYGRPFMTPEQMALIPFPGPAFPAIVTNNRPNEWREKVVDGSYGWRTRVERPEHLVPFHEGADPFTSPGDVLIFDWGRAGVDRAIYQWRGDQREGRWVWVNYYDPHPRGGKAWDNALSSILDPIGDLLGSDIVQLILAGIAFLPGIGTAVVASAAALAAIGRGESLGDVALSAARGALPGGQLAKVGFDVAVGLARGDGLQLSPEQALALSPVVESELGPEAVAGFEKGVELAS